MFRYPEMAGSSGARLGKPRTQASARFARSDLGCGNRPFGPTPADGRGESTSPGEALDTA